jgi:hypothetical protein
VLYFPAGQASQFTPFQFAGGSSWVPTGKFCQVVFHPPTPVKPALQVQAVWVPALTVYVRELAGHAYLIPHLAQDADIPIPTQLLFPQ